MISYPVYFHGESDAGPGMSSAWETSASAMSVMCAVPVEFEGGGGHFSPEDYFLMALQNCFVATFKVFSHYSKLQFSGVRTRAKLTVDKSPEGQPMMKELHLHIFIDGAQDLKKAKLLAQKTLDTGFILKSVKTTIIPEVTINDERVV